jgi:hypothetical protein
MYIELTRRFIGRHASKTIPGNSVNGKAKQMDLHLFISLQLKTGSAPYKIV